MGAAKRGIGPDTIGSQLNMLMGDNPRNNIDLPSMPAEGLGSLINSPEPSLPSPKLDMP